VLRTIAWISVFFLVLATGCAILWRTDPARTTAKAMEPGPARPAASESEPSADAAAETIGSIKGRVIRFGDVEGFVGGARATLEVWRGKPKSWWKAQPEKPIAVVRTDAEGYYTIPRLESVNPNEITVIVRASGWATESRTLFALVHDEDEFTISLYRAYTYTGRVTDEHDRPVAGASVFAVPQLLEDFPCLGLGWTEPPDRSDEIEFLYRRGMKIPRPYRQVVTGGDGRYSFSDQPVCMIYALDRHGLLGVAHEFGESENEGQRITWPVRILRRGSLTVSIRDAAGKPMTGDAPQCSLRRDDDKDWRGRFEHWRGNGELVFSNLPVGHYSLLVWPGGCRPEERSVSIPAGTEARLAVTCREGLRLTGRVEDENGRPLRDASVNITPLCPWLTRYGDFIFDMRTGDDGRFRAKNLPVGRVRLRVLANRMTNSVTTVFAGSTGNVVRMSSRPLIRGRLIAPAGESMPKQVSVRMGSRGSCYCADVAGDGSFSCPVSVCTRWVVIRADRWPPFTPRQITFLPTVIKDLGSLKKPPGRTLRGRVLGPDGKPVAKASVLIVFPNWSVQEIDWSDSEGRFTLHGLPHWEGVMTVAGSRFQKRIGSHDTAEQVIRLPK